MDEMKTCSKCGETKDISEFGPHKRAKDKHQSACKECCAKQQREYRKTNKFKEYHENRCQDGTNAGYSAKYNLKNQTRRRAYSNNYRKERLDSYAKKMKEYRARNQEKYRARYIYKNYILSHDLAIPTYCQECHQECKPHAHHYLGYAPEHALDVIYLCKECHIDAHRKHHLNVTNLDISDFTEPIDTGSLALCDSNNHIS